MEKTRFFSLKIRVYLCLSVVALFFAACTNPAPPTTTAVSDTTTQSPTQPTDQPVRTLVPTFTPIPSVTPLATATSAPVFPTATAEASTPIPFDKTVVELRYTIPAIGLDRRLEGKLGGEIILADEATGVILQHDSDPPQMISGNFLSVFRIT